MDSAVLTTLTWVKHNVVEINITRTRTTARLSSFGRIVARSGRGTCSYGLDGAGSSLLPGSLYGGPLCGGSCLWPHVLILGL
jgi:hypothetical protein